VTVIDVPDAIAEAERVLLAPGGPFEMTEAVVLGQSMVVFRNRLESLREIVAASPAHGTRDYIVFTDGVTERRISFVDHERLVASTAAALAQRYGVGPGDRVAILAANCAEWIITFWATVSLGAVAVGLNGWWTGPEIRFGLEDSQPTVLVADRRRLDRLDGDSGVPTVVIEDEFQRLTEFAPDAALPDVPISEDDRALILYTSGTTGRPKGAVHTHRNVIALLGLNFFHGMRLAMANPTSPDAPPVRQLVTSPLFHVSGLHNGAIAFLLGGISSVWTTGRFDPELVLTLIEREQITGWSSTPTMLHRVVTLSHATDFDTSTLRTGGGGGAPFTPELRDRAREVFPGLRNTFGVGYGLTECSALATLNSGPELIAHPDSVGRPLPTVQLEIRNPDTGAPVADGMEGEIHLRGPMVMLEYWDRPDATAATIGPGRWLRTGDLGHMNGGRLYLAARRTDLILRGGENVYPAEIEHRLETHASVAEAVVMGVPDEDLGQRVLAIVVPADGVTVDTDDLAAHCAEALAYFKVPAEWVVRATPLPRNAAGKVLKHVLAAGDDSPFIEE
jgi:long-chain acyl-CoA synthetase